VHLLLVLVRRHGRRLENGAQLIELPVSRRDLASMIGTRHETISRIISRLETDGIAYFSGRQVTVPNVETLAAETDRLLVT
jgi:CRP/FNR family transcriptional regulator